MGEQVSRNPDDEAPVETETKSDLMQAIAAFQAKFPDFTNTDFSDPNNLFVFSDPDRYKRVQFIKAYASSRGFNAHIGSSGLREREDGTLVVNTENKKGAWVNVPIIQRSMDRFSQTWEFGQEEEAAAVAEIVANGITVNQEFLDQEVTVKEGGSPDSMVFQTFRDLLLDLTRLEIIQNDRIQSLIGPSPGDRKREIRVRRPQALSSTELTHLTLHLIDKQAEKGNLGVPLEQARLEVTQGTPRGHEIMRGQVVQIEAQLALVMMDRFSTSSNS